METPRRSNRMQKQHLESTKAKILFRLRGLPNQKLKNYEYRKEKRAIHTFVGNKKLHDGRFQLKEVL